jgi:CHAT domain-containing protein
LTGTELMEQGTAAFRHGEFGNAVASFAAASEWFGQQLDAARQCEALVGLGQANYFIGQHRKALENLEKALALARGLRDSRQTSMALNATGNVYLAMGNDELALRNLSEGLSIAQEVGYSEGAAASLNNLGNLYLAQKSFDQSAASYRDAALQAEKSGNDSLATQALVNGATAAFRAGQYNQVRPLLDKATQHLAGSEDSTAKAYTLINAGRVYSDLRSRLPDQGRALVLASAAAYNKALQISQKLGDQRTSSYAYGNLAKLYENERQYQEALELTRLATFAAQQSNAPEALYQWHWQTGRIHAKLGKLGEAIASYRLAIRDLQSIREELASCYASPESSYQKTAAVVSAELVDLLLQRASRLQPGETDEPFLAEARDTLEILKIYELREYFRDDCLDAARTVEKKLDVVSERAFVIYPVLLPDRVELLASFAGKLRRYILPVGTEELNREALRLRRLLTKRTTWEFLPYAQKLYDWLIRPLENDLKAAAVDTLVFVPDGLLRTIPMAALHDGSQFLINRYPIAITPSLILTDPQPLNRKGAKLLSLGVTESVQGFASLPYVADELNAIRDLYGGEILLNDQFRLASVEQALKQEPYSIVHIASHGQFGGDVDDTFLVAYDEKFTMGRFGQYVGLYKFREEPLDLITLSACETAAGDDRAALGLAGVAVRSGARSALATLWHVNDPASYELVVEFYRQLRDPALSRAAALQAAQLKLLNDQRYDHPGYWAPFLLINNWL